MGKNSDKQELINRANDSANIIISVYHTVKLVNKYVGIEEGIEVGTFTNLDPHLL